MEHQPQTKQCQNCHKDFTIEPGDFVFYEKMKVPAPTWCPECRLIRRLVIRNEHFLYRSRSGKTGKTIFSMYPSTSGVNVWAHDEWWQDNWDQNASGRDYNFSKSFFEQYADLLRSAPVPNLSVTQPIDSDYSNNSSYIKNCYLSFGLTHSENVMYSENSSKCTDCIDSSFLTECSLCYECFFSQRCSRLQYCSYCEDCYDMSFCYECLGCSNCVGCVGLKKKSFYILNQPYTKESYQEKIKELNLLSRKKSEEFLLEVKKLRLSIPVRYARSYKNENCVGEYISNSKNVSQSYYINSGENLKFCSFLYSPTSKDSYDHYRFGLNSELIYESSSCGDYISRILFSYACFNNCIEVQYSYMCNKVNHLFGCVGLNGKSYCILNKQYTKEEYEVLVPKIIEHMNNIPYVDKKGRVYKYGEFFPAEISPLAYNETIANEYFPLTKEEAVEKGFNWRESERSKYAPTLITEQIPDSIENIDGSITKEIIICEHKGECNDSCTGAFKITSAEFDFYKRRGIPLPTLCPTCRYMKRSAKRASMKLYHRHCMKPGCTNEFETSYAPDRPEIVYCERCYQQEVE